MEPVISKSAHHLIKLIKQRMLHQAARPRFTEQCHHRHCLDEERHAPDGVRNAPPTQKTSHRLLHTPPPPSPYTCFTCIIAAYHHIELQRAAAPISILAGAQTRSTWSSFRLALTMAAHSRRTVRKQARRTSRMTLPLLTGQ